MLDVFPHHLSTLLFETGSLIEHGAGYFAKARWLVSPQAPSVTAFQCWGYRGTRLPLAYTRFLGISPQSLMISQEALCPLIHVPSAPKDQPFIHTT